MSENKTNCTHNCSTCGEDCSSKDLKIAPNKNSSVKKVIGIVSGKGGVGKSMVSALMAVSMRRREYKTAIMDADITGPSIPKMFGLKERAKSTDDGLLPETTKTGIDVMSINLLLEDETAPVIWRGPVIGGVVGQFWSEVIWENEDYMFIDMPPGTGDVALTIFQSLPIDGIIIVTSPQELVSMIVEKAMKMAVMMDIPVIGIVENYSYIKCPDCGKEFSIFGESRVDEVAEKYGLEVLAKIPFNPEFAKIADRGLVELFEGNYMEHAADIVEQCFPVK